MDHCPDLGKNFGVEPRGLEPLTPTLPEAISRTDLRPGQPHQRLRTVDIPLFPATPPVDLVRLARSGTPPTCHPVCHRPAHRGAGRVQGDKVERPTGRTTLAPWTRSARLARVDGGRDGATIPEPERSRRRHALRAGAAAPADAGRRSP